MTTLKFISSLTSLTTSDELLLERLNMACANEKERQDKKKQAAPQRHNGVHAVQSSDEVETRNAQLDKALPHSLQMYCQT